MSLLLPSLFLPSLFLLDLLLRVNPLINTVSKALTPLLIAGSLATLAYTGICFALYSYQRKLIFRPLPNLIRTPADIGIPYEEVWIPINSSAPDASDTSDTSDAHGKLHGWWLPNPGSHQTLLFCHGNYGNISYNLERIHFFYDLGFSVLAFDYRGFGQSVSDRIAPVHTAPVPTEQSTFSDAETAWQYLIQTRQIRPENLTILGHSMGGAIAIHLATHHPEAARLIIESSFTTMEDAVHAKKIYRIFPIEQLLTEPFDSISKVKNLKMPVLYTHGDQDLDIPVAMSQSLYTASPEPKQLWVAPGAGHNDLATVAGNHYKRVVQAFINSNTPVKVTF